MKSIVTRKKCTKCGETKFLDKFHKTNQIKSGYGSWCELCYRAYHTTYYHRNEEYLKEQSREFYSRDRERHIRDAKNWASLHPEKKRRYKNNWKKKNPDKVFEHDQIRKARVRGSNGTITAKEWRKLKEMYNHTCLSCMRKEPEIKLELDHVLPLARGGRNVIENAQPLCRSCNATKNAKHIDYRPNFKKKQRL